MSKGEGRVLKGRVVGGEVCGRRCGDAWTHRQKMDMDAACRRCVLTDR
jgi:hypothetical protein